MGVDSRFVADSRRTAELADRDARNVRQVLSGLAGEETTAAGDAPFFLARLIRIDRIANNHVWEDLPSSEGNSNEN